MQRPGQQTAPCELQPRLHPCTTGCFPATTQRHPVRKITQPTCEKTLEPQAVLCGHTQRWYRLFRCDVQCSHRQRQDWPQVSAGRHPLSHLCCWGGSRSGDSCKPGRSARLQGRQPEAVPALGTLFQANLWLSRKPTFLVYTAGHMALAWA